VEANIITNKVEEDEDSTTCANVGMMESDDKEESMMLEPQSPKENMTNEEEENPKLATPRTKIGSNDVNNTPKEVGSKQCLPQRKTILLIVRKINSIIHRTIYKPKGELWIQELELETSHSVYAI
jgi:hypothetical protein